MAVLRADGARLAKPPRRLLAAVRIGAGVGGLSGLAACARRARGRGLLDGLRRPGLHTRRTLVRGRLEIEPSRKPRPGLWRRLDRARDARAPLRIAVPPLRRRAAPLPREPSAALR